MKYPFRFIGPQVGDKVFWVRIRWTNPDSQEETIEIVESKIVKILDAYDWAPREKYEEREEFCVFYDIEDFESYSLTFGDDLFLTREEAEEFIKTCNQ